MLLPRHAELPAGHLFNAMWQCGNVARRGPPPNAHARSSAAGCRGGVLGSSPARCRDSALQPDAVTRGTGAARAAPAQVVPSSERKHT